MLTKDSAICIRAVDYSETSQVVTFFTEAHGKVDAIAKGSKRPKSSFGGAIEIFSRGNIVFIDSGRDKLTTLTEFEAASNQTGIINSQTNLFVLNCRYFTAELVNKLTNDFDPHPELFRSFLQFLNDTQRYVDHRQVLLLLILFQLSLLKEVGLQPVLDCCVNCKSPHTADDERHEIYFSSSANGIVCMNCEMSFPDKIRISQQVANCLGYLKLIPLAKQKILLEIEAVLVHHFTNLLGHLPKMAKYIVITNSL